MRSASIDVDAQKCFTSLCPLELPIPEGELIVDELNAQAAIANFRLGSKDAHPENAIWIANEEKPPLTPISGKYFDLRWNKHAVPGTLGFELLDGLPHPADYDFFVWKGIEPDMHPYGVCYHDLTHSLSTGVIEYLNSQCVSIVFLGGLAFDYCVKTSALQLINAGFTVVINLAATRATSLEAYQHTIDYLSSKGVKFVKNTQELVR